MEGIEARAVDVQVQIGPGLPAFAIVGLPDKAVAESRERVRGALNAIGLAASPRASSSAPRSISGSAPARSGSPLWRSAGAPRSPPTDFALFLRKMRRRERIFIDRKARSFAVYLFAYVATVLILLFVNLTVTPEVWWFDRVALGWGKRRPTAPGSLCYARQRTRSRSAPAAITHAPRRPHPCRSRRRSERRPHPRRRGPELPRRDAPPGAGSRLSAGAPAKPELQLITSKSPEPVSHRPRPDQYPRSCGTASVDGTSKGWIKYAR